MLICPRCEKSMESHVDGECQKRLSRRFFIGALGTAFGAAAMAKVLPNVVEVPRGAGAAESLIQVVAPKVRLAATIRIESSGNPREEIEATVRYVARTRGVPVIGKIDGEVVAYVDPNDEEYRFLAAKEVHGHQS